MSQGARRALVTGATSGLGLHVCERLARDGWSVTGVGRRDIESAGEREPGELSFLRADLGDRSAVSSLLESIEGLPQLLVLAAVAYPSPSDEDLTFAFEVNALSAYRLGRALLARGPRGDPCQVVVINSESINRADERSGTYAASKAALRVLTHALAASCRGSGRAVATLTLGPLADERKTSEIVALAATRKAEPAEITRLFLRRSNPDLLIDRFIDFDACYSAVSWIASMGPIANGMVVKLDGGSAGSLG